MPSSRAPLITLTTDFGTRDWFVGAMKGVLLGLNPRATIVDLTHDIPPGDIRAGAFALAASVRFFPKGTVHVAVVDPGVGSARRPIGIQTADSFFVGPDNGLLSWALAPHGLGGFSPSSSSSKTNKHPLPAPAPVPESIQAIHVLQNLDYFLQPLSRTFHGRDIFAPVAAHLSRGVPLPKLGPALSDFVRLAWPEPQRAEKRLRGEVIYLDRFGNAITNLDSASLHRFGQHPLRVTVGRCLCPVAEFYQAVPSGKPVAVLGSSGLLEIVVNQGNASLVFHLRVGDSVAVRPAR